MKDEPSPGLREELGGPDEAGSTTARTGAAGEASRDDEPAPTGDAPPLTWTDHDDDAPLDTDNAVIGQPSPGGSPLSVVAPSPDTTLPDPLGSDDEDREQERSTR